MGSLTIVLTELKMLNKKMDELQSMLTKLQPNDNNELGVWLTENQAQELDYSW